MRQGDLVRLRCDERFYARGGREVLVAPTVVQRGELMTVIEPPGKVSGNTLVLHPTHGLGVIHYHSLEVVDEAR